LAIVWLERRDIEHFHGDLLERYGGLAGRPIEDLLEVTLARPQHLLAHVPESTLFELAAAYGYGFARNHCFPDGNKRVALAAMDVFLMVNGQDLTAEEVEAVTVVRAVAAGEMSQEELAGWLAASCVPLAEGEL